MAPAQAFAGISDDVCGGRQLASMTICILLLVNDDGLGNKSFYVFETAGRLFRLFKLTRRLRLRRRQMKYSAGCRESMYIVVR